MKKSLWVPPQSFTHTGKWTGQSWGMTTSCFGMSLSFLGKMMAFNLDGLPHQDKGLSTFVLIGKLMVGVWPTLTPSLHIEICDLRFEISDLEWKLGKWDGNWEDFGHFYDIKSTKGGKLFSSFPLSQNFRIMIGLKPFSFIVFTYCNWWQKLCHLKFIKRMLHILTQLFI